VQLDTREARAERRRVRVLVALGVDADENELVAEALGRVERRIARLDPVDRLEDVAKSYGVASAGSMSSGATGGADDVRVARVNRAAGKIPSA
jgi:hypothetical protein